jgi:hypothetical protein
MTAVCVHSPCPQPPATYTPTITVTDSDGAQASTPLVIALAGKTHALKVTIAGTGSGKVSSSPAGITECGASTGTCTATYVDGTVVTLLAKPDAGSRFTGWSGGGCSGTDACQLTIGADTTLTADFEKAPPAPSLLRIRRVRPGCAPRFKSLRRPLGPECTKLKIAVEGTIAKAARGTVSVKVSTHLHGRRVTATKRAQIQGGHWHARLELPGIATDSNEMINVTARFEGSPGVQGGHAKRHVRLGMNR